MSARKPAKLPSKVSVSFTEGGNFPPKRKPAAKGARTVREIDAAVRKLERADAAKRRTLGEHDARIVGALTVAFEAVEMQRDSERGRAMRFRNGLPPLPTNSTPRSSSSAASSGTALERARIFCSRCISFVMHPVSFFTRKKSPLASPRN
jgi:hypothetical protein